MELFNGKRRTFTADIKRKSIKNINFNKSEIESIAMDSVVVRKDALFYENLFGVITSIEYDTKLATEQEAIQLLEEEAKRNGAYALNSSCLYLDTRDLKKSESIPIKDIKMLKKTYRDERNKKYQ